MPLGEVKTPLAKIAKRIDQQAAHFTTVYVLCEQLLAHQGRRSLAFFVVVALVLALVLGILAIPIIITFFETGLVLRIPTRFFARFS